MMRFQDILLQIDSFPQPTPEAAIDAAVAFAQALGGHISAVAAHVDIPLKSNVLADRLVNLSAIEKEWEAESLAGCKLTLQHFEASARAAGVFAGAQKERIGLYSVGEIIAQHARTRDLCIVPLGSHYDGQLELAQQVIFLSGRPVLIFAAGQSLLKHGGLECVVVAWDGSRSAARALADALPVLERASKVRIVTFLSEKKTAAAGLGTEAIRHLKAHGIDALAEEVDVQGGPIGQALDACVARNQADLLVMGAYGHSRLQEFILGGATEHVLHAPPCPVLLSH